MARNQYFFDQSRVSAIIDGFPAKDFMSGDAIRINFNTEGSSIEVGLDTAKTTFSSDRSGTIEMDFKGTSTSLDRLTGLWKRATRGGATLFTIVIVTSATEFVTCLRCSISSIGAISTGGKTASARTVVFNCEDISPA